MAAAELSFDEKKALIESNLQEVLNPEIIDAVLKEGRPLKIYWGMVYIFCGLKGETRNSDKKAKSRDPVRIC
jgi:hypothetical protein